MAAPRAVNPTMVARQSRAAADRSGARRDQHEAGVVSAGCPRYFRDRPVRQAARGSRWPRQPRTNGMTSQQPSVTLVGVPFDESSSFLRGAAEAPPKIREALHSHAANLVTEGGRDLGAEARFRDVGDLALPAGAAAFAAADRVTRRRRCAAASTPPRFLCAAHKTHARGPREYSDGLLAALVLFGLSWKQGIRLPRSGRTHAGLLALGLCGIGLS